MKIFLWLVLLGLLMAAVSCSGGGSSAPIPTASTAASPSSTRPAGPSAQEVRGKVSDVALSAKVVSLKEPVDGIRHIAIQDSTTIVDTHGNQIELRTIARESEIEATGVRSTSDSMLAVKVVLLAPP